MERGDGRGASEMRRIQITTAVNPYAEGSVEVRFGKTVLLVTATVEKSLPKWKTPGSGGWITAEYGMLPRATHTRNQREAASGRQGGRTQEIQRLIGRALRQAVDLKALGDLTIQLDCDVVVADGGTRTAAISGGWVALALAVRWCQKQALLPEEFRVEQVAAVSLGIHQGQALLDLAYAEDSAADIDMNLVFNERSQLIEIQGTGERRAMSMQEMQELVTLGWKGAQEVFSAQRRALQGEAC